MVIGLAVKRFAEITKSKANSWKQPYGKKSANC